MTTIMNFMGAYFWIVILIAMIVIEGMTFSLTTIWFAVGALASLIVYAFGGSNTLQWVIFTIVSLLLLIFIRPLVRKVLKVKHEKTNADRIIGQNAIVVEKINNSNATGCIKLMGQLWSARSEDNSIIELGEEVVVTSISGVKAIVKNK